VIAVGPQSGRQQVHGFREFWASTRAGRVMDGVVVTQAPVIATGVPLEWQIQ